MPKLRFLATCAVIVLTGCAVTDAARQPTETAGTPEQAPPQAEDVAQTPRPEPQAGTQASEGGADAAQKPEPVQATPEAPKEPTPKMDQAAVSPPATPAPSKEPKPASETDELLRMSAKDVQDRIGLPVEERDEPPARIWRYDAGDCALKLFLYLDLTDDVQRVLSYTVETAGGTKDEETACYREIKHQYALTLKSIDP